MSQTDSFIEEVTEEVQRERLFKLFKRYGWIGVSVLVLIVAGAGFNEFRKARAQAAAERLGDAVLTALAIQDPADRAAALADLDTSGTDAGPVVALVSAGALADAGDAAAADAALVGLAGDSDTPAVYRDLARLKRLMLPVMTDDERLATVEALSQPGAPFRTLAREQRALMHMAAGENAEARRILEELQVDSETTPELRQRLAQLLVVIGGPSDEG